MMTKEMLVEAQGIQQAIQTMIEFDLALFPQDTIDQRIIRLFNTLSTAGNLPECGWYLLSNLVWFNVAKNMQKEHLEEMSVSE